MVCFLFGVFFPGLSQTNDRDSTSSRITQLCNQHEGASLRTWSRDIYSLRATPASEGPSQSLLPTLRCSLPQPSLSDTDLTVYNAMLETEAKSLK